MNYIYTLKDFRCDKKCPYCITKILDRTEEEDVHLLEQYILELEGEYHYFILSGNGCLLYTSPSPRDRTRSRMPSSA